MAGLPLRSPDNALNSRSIRLRPRTAYASSYFFQAIRVCWEVDRAINKRESIDESAQYFVHLSLVLCDLPHPRDVGALIISVAKYNKIFVPSDLSDELFEY